LLTLAQFLPGLAEKDDSMVVSDQSSTPQGLHLRQQAADKRRIRIGF
jgi:hypothetical protein